MEHGGTTRRFSGMVVLQRVVYTGEVEHEGSEVLISSFKERKYLMGQSP